MKNDWPRDCPRCGNPPTRVYPDRAYPAGVLRQAYCSTCQRCYGPGRPGRAPAVPKEPRPPRVPPKWGGRPASRVRPVVLARDGYRCQMIRDGRVCGRPATTVDHIVPQSKGGAVYDLANLRAACADCNFRGGGLLVSESQRPESLTIVQAQLAAQLDALGLPADVGRRSVIGVLRRMGAKRLPKSDDLDAACAWRRARGPRLATPEPSPRWLT